MAKDISADAISFHNEMVFYLGENITAEQLSKLKFLFNGCPLSANDMNEIKSIQELFNRLQIEKYISVGDYTKFVPKLKLVNRDLCSIVDTYTRTIKSLRTEEDLGEIVISMDNAKYLASEGSTAYLKCTVAPKPDSINWKRGYEGPPSTQIPIDNRKYFSAWSKAPTLVIKEATKAIDEAHYQCSAQANSTTVDGKIVHLEVYSGDDYGQQSSSKSSSSARGSPPLKNTDPTAVMRSQYIGTQENLPAKCGEETASKSPGDAAENLPAKCDEETASKNLGDTADSDNDNESCRQKLRSKPSSSAEGSKTDLKNSPIYSTKRKRYLSNPTTEMHTRNIGERDSDNDNESYRQKLRSKSSSSAEGSKTDLKNSSISSTKRKRYTSNPTTEMHTRNIGKREFGISNDKGCQASFVIKSKTDPKRPELVSDISNGFAAATNANERVKGITFKPQCILVCIDITPARNQEKPSSVHLAKQFTHYIMDGGRIQSSDESRTILDIDEATFEITPHNVRQGGFPYVNISHGMFIVPVGGSAILQSYLIAPKATATSIEWFKIESNQQIAIEIDNKTYFGGSELSPTLIIRKADIHNQGQYFCRATNEIGTGYSNISFVSIQSDNVPPGYVEETAPKSLSDVKAVTLETPKIFRLESKSGEAPPRSKDSISTTLPKQDLGPKTLAKKGRIKTEGSPSDITGMRKKTKQKIDEGSHYDSLKEPADQANTGQASQAISDPNDLTSGQSMSGQNSEGHPSTLQQLTIQMITDQLTTEQKMTNSPSFVQSPVDRSLKEEVITDRINPSISYQSSRKRKVSSAAGSAEQERQNGKEAKTAPTMHPRGSSSSHSEENVPISSNTETTPQSRGTNGALKTISPTIASKCEYLNVAIRSEKQEHEVRKHEITLRGVIIKDRVDMVVAPKRERSERLAKENIQILEGKQHNLDKVDNITTNNDVPYLPTLKQVSYKPEPISKRDFVPLFGDLNDGTTPPTQRHSTHGNGKGFKSLDMPCQYKGQPTY